MQFLGYFDAVFPINSQNFKCFSNFNCFSTILSRTINLILFKIHQNLILIKCFIYLYLYLYLYLFLYLFNNFNFIFNFIFDFIVNSFLLNIILLLHHLILRTHNPLLYLHYYLQEILEKPIINLFSDQMKLRC